VLASAAIVKLSPAAVSVSICTISEMKIVQEVKSASDYYILLLLLDTGLLLPLVTSLLLQFWKFLRLVVY
jgi:hypothetical protein